MGCNRDCHSDVRGLACRSYLQVEWTYKQTEWHGYVVQQEETRINDEDMATISHRVGSLIICTTVH